MSDAERLIVERIRRRKLKESLIGKVDSKTDKEREVDDIVEVYNLMISKGYQDFPEGSSEKKALRNIEEKFDLLGIQYDKAPFVKSSKIPGDFSPLDKEEKFK